MTIELMNEHTHTHTNRRRNNLYAARRLSRRSLISLIGSLVGTGTLQLFFSTSTRVDVEAKPKQVRVPAPAMAARTVRPGVLIALPAVPFQEQSLYDRKLARLKQLEEFMVNFVMNFPSPLDVHFACDILDVTTTDAMEAHRETDYHAYAMLAIKVAEKRFREDALLLHPDKATGLATELRPRCEAAIKFLENARDAIKAAFTAHVVPSVEGVQVNFALSSRGLPKLIVSWEASATLETTVELLPGAAGEKGLLRTSPPEADTCIFCFMDAPAHFKRADCELQVFHTGVDGPQADMDSSATRLVCPVPLSIHKSVRRFEIKKEIGRLQQEKRKYETPIGAAPTAKRGRHAPTPPWRRSGTW